MTTTNDCPVTKLFLAHRDSVFNHVLRMTRSTWQAEEIVQEVFMKVWLQREKLSAIKDTSGWLIYYGKK